MTKIITRGDTIGHYDFNELIKEVEEAYNKYGRGEINFMREFVTTRDGGDVLFAGVIDNSSDTAMTEISPFMPWNKKESVTGYYLYISYESGEALAIVEGGHIVKLRTAAKSAVAAKYLAKKKSKVLGLVGVGEQAKMHAEAFSKQFNFERIVGYSRNPEKHADTYDFIKEKTGIVVETLPISELLNQSDIVVVATQSKEPLFNYKDLHEGQLILALDHAESVSRDLILKCTTFVDSYKTAENEFGPVKICLEQESYDLKSLKGELSDLTLGKVEGRKDEKEIICFQSLGMTHEDLATVQYFYEKLKGSSKEIGLLN